uniref:Thiolase N-terminal domain-containing protein n=1 Tax=Plectus sambesii TaxID=2011161 RepID=A0A914WCF5_9BILA
MPKCNNIVIIDGCRTPVGCFRWSLSAFSAAQLGAVVIKSAVERAHIPSDLIDTVYLGNILSGNVGQNVARQAALNAGIPYSVCATSVMRSCGSGLLAVELGIKSILTGNSKIVVAGGTESETRAPYLVPRVLNAIGHQSFTDELVADAMHDPWTGTNGALGAEKTAADYGISREEQDNFACESYRRSKEAIKNGIFKREIVPLTTPDGDIIDQDEEPNKFNRKKMLAMKPAFKADGMLWDKFCCLLKNT